MGLKHLTPTAREGERTTHRIGSDYMADANTIILVTTEHNDWNVEMLFTTVGAYQEYMQEIYGEDFIEVEYSNLNDAVCELDAETGFVDLFTALGYEDSLWFTTKYRSVSLTTIDEDKPIPEEYLSASIGDDARMWNLDTYTAAGDLVWTMLTCSPDVFENNNLSDEEIQHATGIQSALRPKLIGTLDEEDFVEEYDFDDLDADIQSDLLYLSSYFCNGWSPCFGSDDLPERLAAIGVPERCYAEDC